MNGFDSTVVSGVLALTNIFLICSVNGNTGVKKKGSLEEENYGVRYADKCEVCRVVTKELEHQLNSNFNSPEVLDTGYNALGDKNKKLVTYGKSLIRLQEAMENTCRAIQREYSIHKERKDWTRFARGQSQTFSTLHGLRAKGVKVDLGMPEEMWDKPSAEVTQLKSQCDSFLEDNEDKIEKWYTKESPDPLDKFLCKKVLRKKDQECLADDPKQKKITDGSKAKTKETKPKKGEL